MYFFDPAAGLGNRGHPWFSMACLVPHALLSLSSLIFHTVPKERVVGKPMIWQEYRVHNIIFGVRSVLTALAASLAIHAGNGRFVRQVAIAFSGACVLLANYGADVATEKLRAVENESTTATMPYWAGCSIKTQQRFKRFYAYCQFMATLACLVSSIHWMKLLFENVFLRPILTLSSFHPNIQTQATCNPAWPLSVLLAIQLASLLMTLVRKGLLSARGYHYGYTASLAAPFLVGCRSMFFTKRPDFAMMLVLGYAIYQCRRRGVNKFALWAPVILGRFLFGDLFLDFAIW